MTCLNVHLRHQIILTQPATPAIILFADEHLYGVKLTSYFFDNSLEYAEEDMEQHSQEIVRKHMRFTGRVQGVGFRYRARYAADGMGITGWAKNEWDGSVEMEVQGSEERINHMLTMINKSDYIVIDSIESENIPLEEHETGFHVR